MSLVNKPWTYVVVCFFISGLHNLRAQDDKLIQQFSVQHDNDFLFAIDRYYTAGSFLKYSKQLDGDFIFKNEGTYPLQLDITLGQETYTPRELFESDFDFLERPYAGYLFLNAGLSKVTSNRIFKLGLEIGLAGEQSLAGQVQRSYHELINEFIPVWSGEIANSFHVNTYSSTSKDFKILKSNLFKHATLNSKIALGTRQIFARQEALIYMGNRDTVGASSAFGQLGKAEEFYGFTGIGAEYVLLNALIQGHPFGDDSPFTLPIESVVFSFKAGIAYRGFRNSYHIIYNFRTKETSREGRSQFVTFQFARRF